VCSTVLVFVVALGISASGALAAEITGTASLDGSPLPGVTVTVSGPSLWGSRVTVTDANGRFAFGALPAGAYRVDAEMEAFTKVRYDGITVTEGEPASVS